MRIKNSGYKDGDFNLVELRDSGNIGRLTPHCIIHGAMNTMIKGLWRCFTMYSGNPDGEYPKGVKPIKFKERVCDACCVEEQNEK